MYKTSDFIKYDSAFSGEHGDFSGANSAFTAEERLEFLQRYSAFLQRKYSLNKSCKVVTDDEIAAQKQKLISDRNRDGVRDRIIYDKASISVTDFFSAYKNWKFYGAQVTDGTVIFKEKNVPPTPSCLFDFGANLKKFDFYVTINSDYLSVAARRGERREPLVTTVGKSIDFRAGTAEVAKIQFYDSGTVYARVAKRDYYHHDAIFLGEFYTDRENDFSCTFGKDSYSVTLNGKTTENIAYTNDLPIDTVFITGGMYSVGQWSFRPLKAETDCGTVGDFFVSEQLHADEESIGVKSLPFAVGGRLNADKRIIARVNYKYCGNKRAVLHCDTLNPCGEIRVNGTTVAVKPDFTAIETDITAYLKKGKNDIALIVNPRAPEVNYSWHRNKDPYVGWYLSDFYIDTLSETYLSDLRVTTLKVGPNGAVAEISFSASKDCSAEIFLREISPENGKERSIGSVKIENGKFCGKFDLDVKLWNTENPVLYSVRVAAKSDCGEFIDDLSVETGFRTIGQKNGEILLNGERIILKGALLMQFLPPYENIVKSHTCPTTEEIISEILQIKAMNGNTARLHILGYGTNDKRFAEICDRLGVMLVWTTALIDSLETIKWGNVWRQKREYIAQIREVINHPSIIMWEGSNEFHADKYDFDPMFDEFVSAVKAEDKTRLLCPSSHVYYGGGIYGKEGFYYQDDGNSDLEFNPTKSSYGWNDELVIRSAHNYEILLGYGGKWDEFRKQGWQAQNALFGSKKHAYFMSEFAVIGRQDDTTAECKKYIKNDSYELCDEESALGVKLTQSDWKISQSYQALCADRIIKLLLGRDIDGMTWCCLSGGANDASYLKPTIDFYGYAKYAFYVLKDDFAPLLCYSDQTDVKAGNEFCVNPKVSGAKKGVVYSARVAVKDENGETIDEKTFEFCADSFSVTLPSWQPSLDKNGYYELEYSITEV